MVGELNDIRERLEAELAPLEGEPSELVDAVEEIARALRAFHDSGVQLPARFWVPEMLEDYAAIAEARGARLPDGYDAARAVAARIAATLPLHEPRPCHNDLLAGNLIRA